jgi:hypothetical protein
MLLPLLNHPNNWVKLSASVHLLPLCLSLLAQC